MEEQEALKYTFTPSNGWHLCDINEQESVAFTIIGDTGSYINGELIDNSLFLVSYINHETKKLITTAVNYIPMFNDGIIDTIMDSLDKDVTWFGSGYAMIGGTARSEF